VSSHRSSVPDRDPATALAASGLLPLGTAPHLLRAITGGEVETFVFAGSTGPHHTLVSLHPPPSDATSEQTDQSGVPGICVTPGPIWVERVADPAAWAAASASAARARTTWNPAPAFTVQALFPVEIAPGLFATTLPEPVENVADPLLLAVYGAQPAEPGLEWFSPLCRRLGSYLRTQHEPAAHPPHPQTTSGLGAPANAVWDPSVVLSPGGTSVTEPGTSVPGGAARGTVRRFAPTPTHTASTHTPGGTVIATVANLLTSPPAAHPEP